MKRLFRSILSYVPFFFIGVNNWFSLSLEKLLLDALLDVFKSLSNFNEAYLSSLLDWSDCSDCFDYLSHENNPFSNALDTISLPWSSTIALFNTTSFTFFELESCGLASLSNSLIYFAKWFYSSFAILMLIKLFLILLPKTRSVLNFLKSYVLLYPL